MVVGAAVCSPAAIAHGEASWMHGVLDGAMQFFTSLPSLLPVLMISLLARHDGAWQIAIQAAALGIALLGALVGLPIPGDSGSTGLYARGYLVVLGLLILSNLRLPAGLVLVVIFAAGTLIGLEAGNPATGGPTTRFAPAAGFVVSAIGMYLPTALIADRYPNGWQRITMRVVASWIAAIAAIDIAFMIVRSG
jgi:hypothetical protein